ncbi:MAG: CDP-alcohol phosphatidyltransferase family protein [Acidobacteriaceae bacterium]
MTEANLFTNAKRNQESLLAPLERRALQWLVRHMPAWVSSDLLTFLAIFAMLIAGVCFWSAKADRRFLFGIPFTLALNWFGDSLDGTLARYRNQQRPRYGFYVDHLCDCLSMIFVAAGMALSGLMSPQIAMGVVIAFLMVSVEAYLTAYTLGQFHISIGYFSPTELRVALAIGVVLIFRWPYAHLFGRQLLSLDVGGVCGIAAMSIMFLFLAAKHVAELYNQERLP